MELTKLYFDRIDSLDSQLNSYLTLDYDAAMVTAQAAEEMVVRGNELGPLHGLPIGVKDLEMTKGIRTTSGSLVYKDRVPDADSIVVERIRRAGAIILGKTNTSEFGLLLTTSWATTAATRGTPNAQRVRPVEALVPPWPLASVPWRRAATAAA